MKALIVFAESNVAMLGDLRSLDLRANQLKKLGPTCEVISKIPRLDTLWIEGNPCYPSESSAMRVNFFKKVFLSFSNLLRILDRRKTHKRLDIY